MKSRATTILLIGVILVASGLSLSRVDWSFLREPKRFAEVVPHQLYRSGEVSPAQLAYLKQKYNIRTVICLLDDQSPQTQAEHDAAMQLGLNFFNVPLRGNGASTADDREQLKTLMFGYAERPILVHCAAGTNRTGLAVGMWRLYEQGWPLERVVAEMKDFDFEDGPNHEDLRTALATEAEQAQRLAAEQTRATQALSAQEAP